MRGTSGLLPARNIFKHSCSAKEAWGIVATSTPKKQTSNDIGAEGKKIANDKVDPIVAFRKPPPLPPILGPFVALSLLETWYSNDD